MNHGNKGSDYTGEIKIDFPVVSLEQLSREGGGEETNKQVAINSPPVTALSQNTRRASSLLCLAASRRVYTRVLT